MKKKGFYLLLVGLSIISYSVNAQIIKVPQDHATIRSILMVSDNISAPEYSLAKLILETNMKGGQL